jgi:hypothetical protein
MKNLLEIKPLEIAEPQKEALRIGSSFSCGSHLLM